MLAPLVAILCVVASCVIGTSPNIIVIIGDDVGWTGVSYHNTTKATSSALPEIRTPNIDSLMENGIDLTRHYVYRFCSPSRSSFQSGRLPVHVNTLNVAPEFRNASNPVTGYQGIARTMTGIGAKMKSAGYATHMTGKFD
jgi:arylsulfatase I/J